MSIEAQLDRLNANLESLVGAIAANTSVASALANTGAPAPAPAAEKAAPKKAAKPAKEEVSVAEAVSIVVAAGNTVLAAPETKPEVPQADTDPFADDSVEGIMGTAPSFTLDDVREVSVKLVAAIGIEKGRALVASFNVASLKELPAAQYASFITQANNLIKKNA